MTERSLSAARRAVVRWVLLDGDRWLVTVGILLAFYLLLDPVGHFLTPDVSAPLSDGHSPAGLLETVLSGVFLLVSIVVSVNSLFVSRQQTPLQGQRDRIDAVHGFRADLEALIDASVTPTEADDLLGALTSAIVARVQSLDDALADGEADVRAEVEAYLSYTADRTETVNDRLNEADSTFDLVAATMDYDYSRQVTELRRIEQVHGDDLPADAAAAIDDTLDALEAFAVAREYFKTLYFGEEFATLSKRLLYVSLPAIAVVAFVLSHLGSLPDAHWLVMGVVTVAMAPFALLAAYVLRVATVANRTRATGQFVVADDGRPPWDDS